MCVTVLKYVGFFTKNNNSGSHFYPKTSNRFLHKAPLGKVFGTNLNLNSKMESLIHNHYFLRGVET